MYDHDSDTTALAEFDTEFSEILMPDDTNNLGRALGGAILHWMDVAAAVAGRRFAREQVVTAAMDHVDFQAAIDLGDIVTAYVFATGDTSVDVTVDVHSERPETGDYEATATSFFTMVAVDGDGASTTVPRLGSPTEAEVALREAALDQRRDRRRTVLDRAPV